MVRLIEKIEATRKDPTLSSPVWSAWVDLLRAILADRDLDHARARRLARGALDCKALPSEVRLHAQQVYLDALGIQRDLDALDAEATRGGPVSPDPLFELRWRMSLSQAYGDAARPRQALRRARRAMELCRRIRWWGPLARIYFMAGKYALALGRYRTARTYLRESIRLQPRPSVVSIQLLCMSHLHDTDRERVTWARSLLRTVGFELEQRLLQGRKTKDAEAGEDPDPVGMLFHRLGAASRILRQEEGDEATLDAAADTWTRALEAAGCAHLPVWRARPARPPLVSGVRPAVLQVWHQKSGSADGTVALDAQARSLALASAPFRGFMRFDVPRIETRVRGSFVLQATTHGGDEVLGELMRCRAALQRGGLEEARVGSGALFVRTDACNGMRLLVHMQAPSEVLCEAVVDGRRRNLGRVLLPDRPVSLMLCRMSDRIEAFATTDRNPWLLCGVLDTPASWGAVDVGILAEAPVIFYSMCRRIVCRFRDIRLQTATAGTSAWCTPARTPGHSAPSISAEGAACTWPASTISC